jgi:nitroreductase
MEEEAMTLDVFEAMRTMRAVRSFEPRDIPERVLREILQAATWAPSGSNSQPWAFVVVRDPERKRSLRDLYLSRYEAAEPAYFAMAKAAGTLDRNQERIMRRARFLAEHLHETPVLIFPCIDKRRYPMIFDEQGRAVEPVALYASILPAVQNLLLAARAQGIGGCLTTILRFADAEVRVLLGLPEHVDTTVMLPLGYTRERFGPVSRRPLAEVCYLDRWGSALLPVPTD